MQKKNCQKWKKFNFFIHFVVHGFLLWKLLFLPAKYYNRYYYFVHLIRKFFATGVWNNVEDEPNIFKYIYVKQKRSNTGQGYEVGIAEVELFITESRLMWDFAHPFGKTEWQKVAEQTYVHTFPGRQKLILFM